MEERYEQILTDINLSLNEGYSVHELKTHDKARLDGYIMAIMEMESAISNIDVDEEKIMGKIYLEIVQDAYEHTYNFMIGHAEYMIYSMIDDYHENTD